MRDLGLMQAGLHATGGADTEVAQALRSAGDKMQEALLASLPEAEDDDDDDDDGDYAG